MDNQPQYQEAPASTPVMQPKKKSKTALWAIIMLIVGLAIGAGAIYIWQNSEVSRLEDDLKTEQEKVKQLEKQEPEVAEPAEDKPEGFELSDKEKLSVLTLRQVADSTVGDYYAPIINNVHQDYAQTAPLPIKYSSESGYEIPAMGGMSYFWQKKDGVWKKIGYCTEGGCTMEAGYSYDKLPKELTH